MNLYAWLLSRSTYTPADRCEMSMVYGMSCSVVVNSGCPPMLKSVAVLLIGALEI